MKTVAAIVIAAALALVAAGCGGEEASSAKPEPLAVAGGGVAGAPGKDVAVSGGGADFAQASGASGLPGITVVGTGTASAVPDVSDWSFGVQADSSTATDALKDASESTRRIVAALRGVGIDRSDIRTEQVSVYPRMSSDGRAVDGYTASSSVSVVVRDLGRSGEAVDAAVRAGANQVYGPSLRLSDQRSQYRAAVDAAYEDARARAEAIAAKAGVSLGAAVAIIEGGGYGGPVPLGVRAAAEADLAVPVEPGTQEVTATLTVTFAMG